MENTPPINASQAEFVKPRELSNRFRGLPLGVLCRARDAIAELGISKDTWRLWREAKMETIRIGTGSEYVLTDDIIAFLKSNPKLNERPAVRLQRERAKRKAKIK